MTKDKPMKATLKNINKELKARYPESDYELVRGQGYHYIIGGNYASWYTSSIYCCYLNQQDFKGWIEDCVDIIETGLAGEREAAALASEQGWTAGQPIKLTGRVY